MDTVDNAHPEPEDNAPPVPEGDGANGVDNGVTLQYGDPVPEPQPETEGDLYQLLRRIIRRMTELIIQDRQTIQNLQANTGTFVNWILDLLDENAAISRTIDDQMALIEFLLEN